MGRIYSLNTFIACTLLKSNYDFHRCYKKQFLKNKTSSFEKCLYCNIDAVKTVNCHFNYPFENNVY